MSKALNWQLYVSGYTLLFGFPLLTVPNDALPLLGFADTPEPWGRLAGMLLLSLSYLSFGIYRAKALAMLPYSITVRAFIFTVLLSLAIAGHPPVLYVMAAIVGIGVVGSFIAYVSGRGGRPRPGP